MDGTLKLEGGGEGGGEAKGEEGNGSALKKESDVEMWGAALLTPASAGPSHPRITSPMLH